MTVADRSGQLLRDVVGKLAKNGLVLIDAFLISQPPGIGPAGNNLRILGRRGHVGQTGDNIVLQNFMDLALIEAATYEPPGVLLGGRYAQFIADLLVVVAADDLLVRINQIAGIVAVIGAGAVSIVVEVGVIRVVGSRVRIAVEHAARVNDVKI